MKDIEGSLVIFCVATYGEGDPTDNALELYEWLKDGGHDLSGVRYTVSGSVGSKECSCARFSMVTLWRNGSASDSRSEGCVFESRQGHLFFLNLLQVFGLGNKTYEHYNEMGRFVDKAMAKQGADRVFERGEGDDDSK